jgi:hypothetical protein
MALNINGGTDHAYWTIPGTPAPTGTIAYFLRTTQTTANTAPLAYWGATSRSGWGFLLNSTANKVRFLGYAAAANAVDITSTTSVNDGNPHHVAVRYNRANGGTCQLLIDGTQEATANASQLWTSPSTDFFIQAGDTIDTFWPTYIGDLWEIAHWTANLTDDEISALSKGYPPQLIRPGSLQFYAPLVRDTKDLKGNVLNAISGTSAAVHGKMIGGAI